MNFCLFLQQPEGATDLLETRKNVSSSGREESFQPSGKDVHLRPRAAASPGKMTKHLQGEVAFGPLFVDTQVGANNYNIL